MNKATAALRRSSIRLKSFSTGHCDLNIVISDWKEVRSTAKAFMLAQQTAWKDMAKWAGKEHNSTIYSSLTQFLQLADLWTEVQTEFFEQVSKFKYQFDMILEGEQRIDRIREHLATCEVRESKLKKELKKATKKGTVDDFKEIEEKIAEAKSCIKVAQIEINERLNENEATKAVRLKEGLRKLSDGYTDMARKSLIIFQAQKDILTDLPDTNQVEDGHGLQDIRYKGTDQAKMTVHKAIEDLNRLKRQSPYRPAAPIAPGQCSTSIHSGLPSHQLECTQPLPSTLQQPPPPYSPSWGREQRQDIGFYTNLPDAIMPHYDLPPTELYEPDVAGALMDRARI